MTSPAGGDLELASARISQEPGSVEALVAFANEMARYFEMRPTHGEDAAHWSNVTNAENSRKLAGVIGSLAAERDKLQSAVNALDQERDGFAQLNARLKADNKEMGYAFDVRWGAQKRAIKAWQHAHPGNDLTWPDGVDLIVWSLERIASLEAQLGLSSGAIRAPTPSTNEAPR